jgi:hypothetical protein
MCFDFDMAASHSSLKTALFKVLGPIVRAIIWQASASWAQNPEGLTPYLALR